MKLEDDKREAVEAAAFRRLVAHLRARTDVQNVDLMGWGGFCRNCLGDWVAEEASARGAPMTKDEGRELVYGMPYADYKARHQAPATPEQLARMDESLKRNDAYRKAAGEAGGSGR
jgi:hypothetical protein